MEYGSGERIEPLLASAASVPPDSALFLSGSDDAVAVAVRAFLRNGAADESDLAAVRLLMLLVISSRLVILVFLLDGILGCLSSMENPLKRLPNGKAVRPFSFRSSLFGGAVS